MRHFAVISDSACDMPANMVRQQDVDIVPFTVSFDKINKLTEGVHITNDEFYRRLESSDVMPKTYFPTVGDYVASFKKRLEQGQDILCLCLSSKLSKSYVSALNAQKILSYTYPDRKIVVMDTLLASGAQSLLLLDAVKLSETLNVEAAFAKLEELKKSAKVMVTVASLEQLARGGRMSNVTAAFGKLLKINPIIYLENGALVSRDKAIGRHKALELLKKLTIQAMDGRPDRYDFTTLHSRALSEAEGLVGDLQAAQGIRQTIPPVELGATIGMHTGSSVVATALLQKL